MSWVVSQLGAREHYAIARALHGRRELGRLITEAWVPPGSRWSRLSKGLSQRFHPELAAAPVVAWNAASVAFELGAKLRRQTGWPLILARNHWFQRRALQALSSVLRPPTSDLRPWTLFVYSYAARELLRWARDQGWRTVLGQIDGGPEDATLMVDLHQRHPLMGAPWAPAPPECWEAWREECALADRIVVNSEWSRTLLVRGGIPVEKLQVIPLAYSAPVETQAFQRSYPAQFTSDRPLRVLFLGQVNLRKGVSELLAAARALAREPVEFWLVGPVQIDVSAADRALSNVRWVGPVDRASTADWYRRADVFLFPTHSDGFGLTQLEAMAWKLPVIASAFCGDVVVDGANGLRLSAVTGEAIAAAIRSLVESPARLATLADRATVDPRFSPEALADALEAL